MKRKLGRIEKTGEKNQRKMLRNLQSVDND